MCGEDGIKRAVYNMKEKHAGERGKQKKKNKKNTQKRKAEKPKSCTIFKVKQIVISVLIHHKREVESFYFKKLI